MQYNTIHKFVRVLDNYDLSKRVCRLCGPKIRYAAELYNFIEKAVSAKAQVDLNREADCEDRTKRALPATVRPEQSHAKILLNE